MKLRNKCLGSFILTVTLLILLNSCRKDDNNAALRETIKDIDGNVYTTVTIGSQVWMVENLQVTKYRNGDSIPNVTDNSKWANQTSGACCIYYNDAALGMKYGKLYNWYAVNDSRNIAPVGWHIATDAEWDTLVNNLKINLGNKNKVSNALAAKTDWEYSPDTFSVGYDLTQNNSSGFTALPGGCRFFFKENQSIGGYANIGISGFWWCSEEFDVDKAYLRSIDVRYDEVYNGYLYKTSGFSVRCVKD